MPEREPQQRSASYQSAPSVEAADLVVASHNPGRRSETDGIAALEPQAKGSNGLYASPGSRWTAAAQRVNAKSSEAKAPEQKQDRNDKHVLIEQVYKFTSHSFSIVMNEVTDAIHRLEVPEVPKTDMTKQLLGYAASTLLGAVAGPTAAMIVGSISTAGVAAKAAAAASSLVGGAVKKALETDHAEAAASLADIREAFRFNFKTQLDRAEDDFVAQWPEIYAKLSAFSNEQLSWLDRLKSEQNRGSLRTEAKRQTFVAWSNFLARTKHGAMGAWDHWTENGSPGAIALPGAAKKPLGGPDPARNNVAPNNNSPLLETIQRPMQEDVFGILEIFVYGDGCVVDEPGYRMRLDNVGPKVREEFRTLGKVRDLKVNKVVHLCSNYHNHVRVDPPTSIASVLITADGYVRASNWAAFLKVHFEPKKGPIWDPTGFNECANNLIYDKETAECHVDRKSMKTEISEFASAAQELPLTYLEV